MDNHKTPAKMDGEPCGGMCDCCGKPWTDSLGMAVTPRIHSNHWDNLFLGLLHAFDILCRVFWPWEVLLQPPVSSHRLGQPFISRSEPNRKPILFSTSMGIFAHGMWGFPKMRVPPSHHLLLYFITIHCGASILGNRCKLNIVRIPEMRRWIVCLGFYAWDGWPAWSVHIKVPSLGDQLGVGVQCWLHRWLEKETTCHHMSRFDRSSQMNSDIVWIYEHGILL